jgi:hypothetical protein
MVCLGPNRSERVEKKRRMWEIEMRRREDGKEGGKA